MKRLLLIGLSVLAGGCVLAPREAESTRKALTESGRPYRHERSRRAWEDLPEQPSWRDVLRRALLTNGDLESAYFEWAMAVHRIDQAGSYPSQPIELGFEYMFDSERMKSFDRLSASVGLMDATSLPNKTYQNAKVTWRDAQAAGERFVSAKFRVQRDALVGWADYTLQAERVRLQERNVQLLHMVSETASGRVSAGASQQELLRADVQLKLAENELAGQRAMLDQQRARLNALLHRDPTAPLAAPAQMPERRPLPASDAQLLAMGVDANPQLASLAFDVEGRRDAIERAKLEYLPEINPMAGFTGGVSQFVGAAIVLPTQWPKINAMIDESRADLRRAQAMRDQARVTSTGDYVAAIVAMRNAERQITLFEQTILPLAERTVELTRRGYSSSTTPYLEMIDAQRTLLETQVTLAEARAERERQLADIEMLAGVDIETLASTTQPIQSKELP